MAVEETSELARYAFNSVYFLEIVQPSTKCPFYHVPKHRIDNLYSLGNPMAAAMLRGMIEVTICSNKSLQYSLE